MDYSDPGPQSHSLSQAPRFSCVYSELWLLCFTAYVYETWDHGQIPILYSADSATDMPLGTARLRLVLLICFCSKSDLCRYASTQWFGIFSYFPFHVNIPAWLKMPWFFEQKTSIMMLLHAWACRNPSGNRRRRFSIHNYSVYSSWWALWAMGGELCRCRLVWPWCKSKSSACFGSSIASSDEVCCNQQGMHDICTEYCLLTSCFSLPPLEEALRS